MLLLLYLFIIPCPITFLDFPDLEADFPPSESDDQLAYWTLLLYIFEWYSYKVKDLRDTMGITENEDKCFLL